MGTAGNAPSSHRVPPGLFWGYSFITLLLLLLLLLRLLLRNLGDQSILAQWRELVREVLVAYERGVTMHLTASSVRLSKCLFVGDSWVLGQENQKTTL